ncbi:MAG: radical SAM protein, partial [Bacteroidales bacterium]|nr:radical SAM protein [Bacteroidales bacterium]
MTKNKIILNWMPPATLNFASPSLSALKSYLTKFDYEVKIVYWNLKLAELQCGFLWLKTPDFYDDEMRSLLLFFNYIAIKRNDTNAYNQVKGILIAIKPQYLTRDIDVYDLHMKAYADELDCYIDDILSKIDDSNILYYGMSVMFYQWIFSSILAEKIKIKNQESKIIIGGISSKESAVAYLESFDQFDFALWGESEINLEILSKELIENNENIDFDKLLNTAFRKNDKIKISKHRKCNYIDFSNDKSIFDISDYFEQKKIIDEIFNDQIKERIPIEGARGCHWKKCNFCYLNTGYKYRLKPVSLIIYEIKKQISKYNVFSFCFLDNDLVGLDKERFKHLLDELIEIKKVYPNFSIDMAEVITNGIDSSIIRKMFFAGFESVQIGYESPSNSLLKKIRKKNSFASNLLFIKFAQVYNIGISGANVIMGLLEETDNDIIEAIKNLHHLRFFLLRGRFRHSYTSLGIMHTSSYYDKLENKIEHLSRNQI